MKMKMKNRYFMLLCASLLILFQGKIAVAESGSMSASHTGSSCTTTPTASSSPTITSSSIALANIMDTSTSNLNYSPASPIKKKKSKKKKTSPFAGINQMLRMGDYVRAHAALQKVLTTHPHIQADKFNLMGIVAQETGDLVASLEYFNTALSVRPRHLQALYNQGQLYLEIGDVQKARNNFNKLDSICWLGCEEKRELKTALEQAMR